MMNEVKSSSLKCHVTIWCPQQSFGVGLEVSGCHSHHSVLTRAAGVWSGMQPGNNIILFIIILYLFSISLLFGACVCVCVCLCVSFFWGRGAESSINILHHSTRGPGSSLGIVSDYGLDSPGSNPGGDEIFRPSGPVLGPTQPPVQWVLGLSGG